MVKAYIMRTGVIIDDKQYFIDLYRVRHIGEFEAGDELVVISPLTDKLCRVRVVRVTDHWVAVELMRESPAAVFWKISRHDVKRLVYKVEKTRPLTDYTDKNKE